MGKLEWGSCYSGTPCCSIDISHFCSFLFDINCHECQTCIAWKFIRGIQPRSNSAGVQDRISAWNRVLLVPFKWIPWEFTCSVHGCWRRTKMVHFLEMRYFLSKKKLNFFFMRFSLVSQPASQPASQQAKTSNKNELINFVCDFRAWPFVTGIL